MIETAICTALAGVTELTGGIFVGKADPGAAFPFAVLSTANGTKRKSGKRAEYVTPFTLAVYDQAKTTGKAAADACRVALEGASREADGVFDMVIRSGDISTRAASRTVYLFQISGEATYCTADSTNHTEPEPEPEPEP